MKKSLALIFGVVVALMLAPAANATISDVFQNTGTPLSCVTTTTAKGDFRYCGGLTPASPTTVASWDGTPLDVEVAYPEDPGSADGSYPIVGMYHGWNGNKINLQTDITAQNLLDNGIAVFSMSDRGWSNSCGGPASPVGLASKAWPCTQGYIHLMSNAYEVRDAQYMLGQLADDRNDADDTDLLNPTQVGAMGGSYGGAISAQLAMLKDRVQLQSGQLVDWKSPQGKSMAIAGAAPQYTWSDLAASLAPNGSTLDYTWDNPYYGPNGDHRMGVDKQQWVFNLYATGAAAGYYAPVVGTGYPDPTADIIDWYKWLGQGDPFNGSYASNLSPMVDEITANHSAYYIPIDATQTPAPMLISSGWNDDLFPANEGLRLYNKVRHDAPSTPVQFWGVDIGHTPRSNNTGASQLADSTDLVNQQVTWMIKYVKGIGVAPLPTPAPPVGGAIATSSQCGTGATAQVRVAGTKTWGNNWAEMSQGQVTIADSDTQTIEPGSAPADQFVSTNSGSGNGTGTDVCDYAGRTDIPDGAAYYNTTVGTGGFTLLGTPTIEADISSTGVNDQIVARLYDYDPAGIGHERLISRGVYRPMNVGGGFTHQTFQMMPQNYTLEAGHTVKLELLATDSPFTMTSKITHQQPIEIKNMKFAIPTSDASGSAGGQVTRVLPRELPANTDFTADALATDSFAPVSTDNVPATLQKSVTVTLDALDTGISGVEAIYFTTDGSTPTETPADLYDPNNKPMLADGESIKYFAVDRAGNAESVNTSDPAQVDSIPPAAPTLVSGPSGTTNDTSASIVFTAPELGGSNACSLDGAPTSACASPVNLTNLAVGGHTLNVFAIDSVGNVSTTSLAVSWTVQGLISLSVKISGTVKVGHTITAKSTVSPKGTKLTYSWSANGKKVGSKNKLKLSSKWKGKKIVVKVTSKKTGYKTKTVKKTATSKLKK